MNYLHAAAGLALLALADADGKSRGARAAMEQIAEAQRHCQTAILRPVPSEISAEEAALRAQLKEICAKIEVK